VVSCTSFGVSCEMSCFSCGYGWGVGGDVVMPGVVVVVGGVVSWVSMVGGVSMVGWVSMVSGGVVNVVIWSGSRSCCSVVVSGKVCSFSVGYLRSVEKESVVCYGGNITVVTGVMCSMISWCSMMCSVMYSVMCRCSVMRVAVIVNVCVRCGSRGMGSLIVESKVVSFGCSYLRSVLPRCQDIVRRIGSDGATKESKKYYCGVHVV